MRPQNAGLVRRNLTLPSNATSQIAQLKAETGVASDSEIVRQALQIYAGVVNGSVELTMKDPETGEKKSVVWGPSFVRAESGK